MSAADLERKVALTNEKVIGNGSFGVVFQATLVETGETVAVKKVLQDKRFKVMTAASNSLVFFSIDVTFGNSHRTESFRS